MAGDDAHRGAAARDVVEAALYFWHGVLVPDWIIEEPERIDGAAILAEENTEVRAVMMQRWPQALAEMPGVEVIAEDSIELDPIVPPPGILPRLARDIARYARTHPRPASMRRRLLRVPWREHADGQVKVLVFEDPAENGAVGALLAHRDSKSPQDAVARSYGLSVDEYPAEFERSRR